MALLTIWTAWMATPSTPAAAASPSVLLVGTYQGRAGQYTSIQSAVNAAKPGDWILIAPGDYHEVADETGQTADVERGGFGAVLVTTPDLHIRGMNRQGVVVDGTKAGSPPCSSNSADQNYGIPIGGGRYQGRNGIVIYKADGVTVDNLTTCNFLNGAGWAGNDVWWNGGGGSGRIGLHHYKGRYLTATSTYFGTSATASTYGIYSSNSSGGSWRDVYASNFSDSGLYVGACRRVCDMTIDNAWTEYNAQGYSGTNSGGPFLIEHSRFDHNQEGFDTDTLIGDDPPAPQDGTCPKGTTSSITHTDSCWVFRDNVVSHNNDPNVPGAGWTSSVPTGTGLTLSGARNDTVMHNTFADNGAWGTMVLPRVDNYPPVLGQTCGGTGGVQESSPLGEGCVYDPEADHVLGNTYTHDGYFGNPGNVDLAQITFNAGQPQNCYGKNVAGSGNPASTDPSNLEATQPTCGGLTTAPVAPPELSTQVQCDLGVASCPPGTDYPRHTKVVMHPLPRLATMPNPCLGVPANPWCDN